MRHMPNSPTLRGLRKNSRRCWSRSMAAYVQRCVRFGMCKSWIKSFDPARLESLLNEKGPVITRLYLDKTKPKPLSKSTLASQSLRVCSSCKKKLDDSDQDQTTRLYLDKTSNAKPKPLSKMMYLQSMLICSSWKKQIEDFEQDQTTRDSDKFDIQEKLSSDIASTSTSMPHSPSP
ncbi:uncharacterized protein LOC111830139 [Capsella rubella]|uniref:uncharacterized protein LOC111830139 n=1 Tax=Capsella rubella TaxID=81985 RepID=UPI000CD5102D|nr:uncharacterized protein LOC111830139 [Capsella rubella]